MFEFLFFLLFIYLFIYLFIFVISGLKLRVRLWDGYAERVWRHIQNTKQENAKFILVMQYAKIKSWAGIFNYIYTN